MYQQSNDAALIPAYLDHCRSQKRLDEKTLRAYAADLHQFAGEIAPKSISALTADDLYDFVRHLHERYKPKTVKRKIASVKALFHYLEYREIIGQNPFHRMQLKFREPAALPRTIPLHTMEQLLSVIYRQIQCAQTSYQRKNALRDAAVCELLFATGMRISELCALTPVDIDLCENTILIFGKGSKERRIQIGSPQVSATLRQYNRAFAHEIQRSGCFFTNQSGRAFSDQAVRRMLNRYTSLAAIPQHITPHMFRHTFATALLDADVDIRYIQEMLGHSSIHTTEIYTHVSLSKQKAILTAKHPRNSLALQLPAQ